MGKGPQKKINQRCSGKSREAACDAPLLNGNESVRRPTKLNVQAKEFKPQVYTHGPANFRDCLPFGGLPIPAPVPIATSLLPAVVTAPVPLQQISPDYPNVGPSSSLDVPPENPCFPVLRPAPPLPVPVAPMVNGQSPATANVQNGAMQMQIPDVNPVVYPDRYGRPGTAFYMPWAYVPDTAIPLPECDQNGVIHTVYYVQVQSEHNSILKNEHNLPIISNKDCQRILHQSLARNVLQRHFARGNRDIFCTGSVGHKKCMGDSGGPLMFKHKNRWFAIGIVTFGYHCGLGMSGYTNVTTYLSWIRENIAD